MRSRWHEQTRTWGWWGLVLVGQFAFIFAVLALSGPGRIDIVDGQTRFEVARSLVEHGDSIIRDADVWMAVLTGRDGQRYTNYRFPQSGAGVIAIVLADDTGPLSEGRRHFFFTLISAFACALLAITYTLWFRSLGLNPYAAVGWSCAGILCTPNWFYGTSTFDDILGATAVVATIVLAAAARRRGWGWALAAGLVLGFAFNCKQPLGIFVLPALAAAYDRELSWRRQWGRLTLIVVCLASGVAAQWAYHRYKYPPEALTRYAEEWAKEAPVWTANPVPPLFSLLVSPGAGVIWYCPALLITLYGTVVTLRRDKWVGLGLITASGAFLLFHCFVSFYKGDPSWGPRYLTPLLALLWLGAPLGAELLNRRLVMLLLTLGLLVQGLALSVDPQRLHFERKLPSVAYHQPGLIFFNPAYSHLLNRPREIVEIYARRESAPQYTPARSPTFATPGVSDRVSEAIWDYQVFASLRPWWVHQRYLAPEDRPVDLVRTLLLLAGVGLGGLALMLLGCRGLQTTSCKVHVAGSTS